MTYLRKNKTETTILAILLAFVAMIVYALFTMDVAQAKPTSFTCPKGYFDREIRVYGQRLESDPRPELNPVVTQNDPDAKPADRRYVVVRACVRPLNAQEYDVLFHAGTK